MRYTVHFVYSGTLSAPGVRQDTDSEWDEERDGRPSDETLRTVILRLIDRYPLNTETLSYAYIESKERGSVAWWYRNEQSEYEASVAGTRFDDREVV